MDRKSLKDIRKEDYKIYKEKSKDAHFAMHLSLKNELWGPSAREAVFACINAADALLAKYAGFRNMSKNHMDIVEIVSNGKLIPINTAKNQANRLRKIIAQKNLVDYENKLFSKKKAQEIVEQADRFFSWAMEHLS